MKSASAALIAHLNSAQQFIMADLYEITMVNGSVLSYTSWDVDVSDSGNTYSANSVMIERSRVRTVLGVEVDTLDLTIYPHATDMVNSKTFLQACSNGSLDGATITMRRAFLDGNFANIGSFINFSGRISNMSMSRDQIEITVKSDLELLNVQLPRHLYQSTCLHTLYDGGCGLNRANWVKNLTVSSYSGNAITCSDTSAAGYFDLGYIEFTSGNLTGVRRTIKSNTVGVINLLSPLPFSPAVGDAFKAYAGCDKTMATCASKFNNKTYGFQAFPFIPVPETTR